MLCCNSSSRMIRAMRCLRLMLVPQAANRIFANVGIKYSALHIFKNLISRRVFSYLVLMFSKERIKDHCCRDHASHIVKHNIETSHTDVNTGNFKIIDMNFSNNKGNEKLPSLYGSKT